MPEQIPNLALTDPMQSGPIIVAPSMPIFRPFVKLIHVLIPQEKANRAGKKFPLRVKVPYPQNCLPGLPTTGRHFGEGHSDSLE
jgi:hypothetical protein